MRFLTWLATNALSLAAAAWLIQGIRFLGPDSGSEEVQHKLVPLLIVALILGVLTSFVKPILTFLSFPFIIVTLGLFLLVINAVLLLLAGQIAEGLDVDFRVDGFVSAVLGSIVITVVTWIVDGAIGPGDQQRGRR